MSGGRRGMYVSSVKETRRRRRRWRSGSREWVRRCCEVRVRGSRSGISRCVSIWRRSSEGRVWRDGGVETKLFILRYDAAVSMRWIRLSLYN